MKPEVKSLFLVRHAKAEKSWDGLSDIDRPLHPEGISEAKLIAEKLFKNLEIPQLIISSTAQRAAGTALIFQRILKVPLADFRLSDKLYEMDINDLHEFVSALDDRYHSVMLFGHNPSFSLYASAMDPSIIHMPTGATVKFNFEVDKWRHTSYINADKKLFIYP